MISWLMTAALALSSVAPAAATPATAPPPAQVMQIPAPLQQALQEQVISRSAPGRARLQQLMAFMIEPDGLGISYRHDADYTVAEIWQTREANCLSFTLLTVALARAAGLDAHGQEIARTLSWYSDGDTLYFSNHVNAGIRLHRARFTIDVASDSVLTSDPPETISDQRLLAVYYSNRAATLLTHGDYQGAARHIDAALLADESYASAWNNAGVLKLRSGQPEAAERDFLRALEHDREHDGAMMNLSALYTERGDTRRAAQYLARIEAIRDDNPFHYFVLAVEAESRGDYTEAVDQYRRAIRLHNDEHRFHFGLARAYLHLGQAQKAGRALQRAHALSSGDLRARYQAKLELLRRTTTP